MQILDKYKCFFFCFAGICMFYTLQGLLLESLIIGGNIGEFSLTLIYCLVNSAIGYVVHKYMRESKSKVSHFQLGLIGFCAFGSAISSIFALRYVTYITRILGKSCKSIPILVIGSLTGRVYDVRKYISILLLSIGVGIFLYGTNERHRPLPVSSHTSLENDHNAWLGLSALTISLLFDGAIGTLEDRFFAGNYIGPFYLMFVTNSFKCIFSLMGFFVSGEGNQFLAKFAPIQSRVLLYCLVGACGQLFIWLSLHTFGALTTSVFGTCRKVLSIIASVMYFQHILSAQQILGLFLSFSGLGIDWIPFHYFVRSSVKHALDEKNVQRNEMDLYDFDERDQLLHDFDSTEDDQSECSVST